MKNKSKKKKNKEYKVFVQRWWEDDPELGNKPDGCSLHLSIKDCAAFIKACNKRTTGSFCFSNPGTERYWTTVSAKVYAKVKASKNGIKVSSVHGPGC